MRETSSGEIPAALLAGRLQGISLPDLLLSLCRRRRTGVLSVSHSRVTKSVFVDEGQIVFASSSDPNDRLGELFLRRGQIDLDQLDQAVQCLSAGKRLGTLLVEAGSLRPEELTQGVIDQVRSIVLELFTWDEGDYQFNEGALPTDEVITLNMKTSAIVLQGIGRIRSFDRIRRSVGPLPTVYGITAAGRTTLEHLELSEGEELLVARLEQTDDSIEVLCQEVFLSNFEIYQTLWALKVLGVIEEREFRLEHPGGTSAAGQLAEESFAAVLTRICRSGEQGVLYVTRESRERTFHIKKGRCVFATSNNPDDSLIAYLLRRGVISLRDREETTKRLLTNKRVGTILRELGVIDDEDLQALVRQQLKEIVYDTFRWEEGDFMFVPGELPSLEEITLEPTVEALVAGGLRRVTNWNRINEGCGGPDHPLKLTPSYLDVLDAMRAGPEEWELITALKQPQTPREICRKFGASDYSVYQALWAMRVLSAVESASEEDTRVESSAAEAAQAKNEPTRHIEIEELDSEPEDEVQRITIEDPAEVESRTPDVEGYEPTLQASASVGGVEETSDTAPDETEIVLEPEPEPEPELKLEPDAAQIGVLETATEPAGTDETQVISAEVVAAALQGPPPAETAETPEEPDEPILIVDESEAAECAEVVSAAPRADEPDPGETVRLSREEVDAALSRGARGPDGWEPPQDLDQAISRFNAVQRVIFRTVRTEVGAGAANFIRTCCGLTGEGNPEPLSDAELLADGSWEAEGLRRAVVENRIRDPWGEYQQLIEREIDLLRQHVSEAKAVELRQRVEEVTTTSPRTES